MSKNTANPVLLGVLLVGSQFVLSPLLAQDTSLRGPLGAKPAEEQSRLDQTERPPLGGLSAPGADAMMTPDLLLVKPSNATKQQPEPLKAYVGMELKLQVDQRDIVFDKLHAVMITVANETNRPLMVDGNKATARIGNESIVAAPITVLQKAVLPAGGLEHALVSVGTKIIPTAATVGAIPTIKDMITLKKPVLERYGPDEVRRTVESSRFGRRVLWPRQKTQGILYFQTPDALASAVITIPASTLFDMQDNCILTATP
jgi:hypothetical protein